MGLCTENRPLLQRLLLLLLLLLLLKEAGSATLKESDIHPINPKTPAPEYQLPIDRRKRNGKIVEDCWDTAAEPKKKHWPCS